MDLGYADRVVVVTGGSSGIGLATARLLLAEGARRDLRPRPGAAFVLPVILAYTVLAWRVFGGKAMDLHYD